MGNLRFSLGHVQYDGESPVAFPMAAQVGLGVGTSLLALGVIIIVFIYRWVQPAGTGLGQRGGCGSRGRADEARGRQMFLEGAREY